MGKTAKYLVRISYRGKYFFGFEKKYGIRTVCGMLEKKCTEILGVKAKILYSYIPDFLASVNNFPIVLVSDCEIGDIRGFLEKINGMLPQYIRLLSMEKADDNYNPDNEKLYVKYECQIVNNSNILYDDSIIYIEKKSLNHNLMRMAADYLLGENDFSCFTDAKIDNTFRTIHEINIEILKNNVCFTIEGDAMLPNMIPMIVGELVLVGRGIRQPQEILDIISQGKPDELLPDIPAISENIIDVDFVDFIEKEYHSCNDRWDYYVLNHELETKGRRYILIKKADNGIFDRLLMHIINKSFENGVKEVYIIEAEGRISSNIKPGNRRIYVADIEEVVKFSDIILSYGIRGTWYRVV